jgi:hypothetical protein
MANVNMEQELSLPACEAKKRTMDNIEEEERRQAELAKDSIELKNTINLWNHTLYHCINEACEKRLFSVEVDLASIRHSIHKDLMPSIKSIINYLDNKGYHVYYKGLMSHCASEILVISWRD